MIRRPGLGILILLASAPPVAATLVVDVDKASPGVFEVALTTNLTFDAVEVIVGGDVANGANLIPELLVPGFPSFGRILVESGTTLSPLGAPENSGVFEPAAAGDIALSYGVTNPLPGDWTAGLADQLWLRFNLLSGSAEVSARLFDNGLTVASASQTVASIPEAPPLVALGLLAAAIAARRRRRTRRARRAAPLPTAPLSGAP